jgi:hypothetical protein
MRVRGAVAQDGALDYKRQVLKREAIGRLPNVNEMDSNGIGLSLDSLGRHRTAMRPSQCAHFNYLLDGLDGLDGFYSF